MIFSISAVLLARLGCLWFRASLFSSKFVNLSVLGNETVPRMLATYCSHAGYPLPSKMEVILRSSSALGLVVGFYFKIDIILKDCEPHRDTTQ